jgi:gamma-glutamyltranspeptidase/glutathione hydrolase
MRGIIVAPQPEAVEAGALILATGGNAIDAALACAFVQGVVDPLMTGIGGFGTMQVYMPSRGIHINLDFHARCPAATKPDMWANLLEGETRDGFGFVLRGHVNEVGYKSVAVPASLRAFEDALRDYGTFDWADILAPAIAWAKRGSVVRPYMHANWLQKESRLGRTDKVDKLGLSKTGRAIYFRDDGSLKVPGDTVRNGELARTLERIAREGADLFYGGEIAEHIASDMKANGGFLTIDDLRAVQTIRTAPLRGTYRGMEVCSSAPPGGGLLLIEMLNILESADLRSLGHNTPDYLCFLAEVMKAAAFDKEHSVGDPAFVDVPVDRLTSKCHARKIAGHIARGDRISVARLQTPESMDTTQVCVVDSDGNAVSLTHSLGTTSGVITDGLGFMYNSCMSVFDPRPGRPGSLAPGKARFTSMAPTILLECGAPKIVIGAPGGAHISGAILQAIVNVLDFGMSPFEAVAAPRISATSDVVDVSNRIPRFVTDEMEKRGYPIARTIQGFAFGAPHMLANGREGWVGGADPQRDGMAINI